MSATVEMVKVEIRYAIADASAADFPNTWNWKSVYIETEYFGQDFDQLADYIIGDLYRNCLITKNQVIADYSAQIIEKVSHPLDYYDNYDWDM